MEEHQVPEVNQHACIVIDYYIGGYGPTIRIECPTVGLLRALRDQVAKLASGDLTSFRLGASPMARLSNLSDLALDVVPADTTKTLFRSSTPGGTVAFHWRNSTAAWERHTGLLDALISDGGPAHQYLTKEDVDDALVEVCLAEQ
ncbi:MAG: hypothetical protein AB7O37_04980 [Vicinamibacteria bacterium]